MKKIASYNIFRIAILVILCIFVFTTICFAQSYERKGNTFEQVSTRQSSTGTKTSYTWKDTKGNEYPIYITKNGRCYVMKVSSRTGNEYKYYLKEDISQEICKELGINYIKPKKKESK